MLGILIISMNHDMYYEYGSDGSAFLGAVGNKFIANLFSNNNPISTFEHLDGLCFHLCRPLIISRPSIGFALWW